VLLSMMIYALVVYIPSTRAQDDEVDELTLSAQLRDHALYYQADNHQGQESQRWLIIPYVNGWLEAISINSILLRVRDYQPFEGEVLVRWTYPTNTLHDRVTDYKALLDTIDYDAWYHALFPYDTNTPTAFTEHFISNTHCPCHDFHAADGRSNINRCDSHIVTGTHSQFTDDKVFLDRLARGSGFREPPHRAVFARAYASLDTAVDDMILRIQYSSDNNVDEHALREWKRHVLTRFHSQYMRIRQPTRPDDLHHIYTYPPGSWFSTMENVVKPLQHLLTFTVSDKSRGNMVATCRNYYVAKAVQMISQQNYYEQVIQPSSDIYLEIVQRIHNILKPAHIPNDLSEKWAYFYILPKVHKHPIKWRPIVAAHNCSTTASNRVLAAILRLTLSSLQEKYTLELKNTGKRKLWMIENSLEFVLTRPSRIDHIFSSDINSMYTNLNQDFVIDAVTREVYNAAIYSNSRCIRVKIHDTTYGNRVDTASWSDCNIRVFRSKIAIYSIYDVPSLIRFVVRYVYFTVGNALFHQTKGIPMGGNASPFLANLALLYLEHSYVDNHPETQLQHKVYRYLDDYCIVNYPDFELTHVYREVYPEYTGVVLVRNEVHLEPNILTATNFLDLNIWVTNIPRTVYISLFDKRLAFGFHIIKFPHEQSNTYTPQARATFFTEVVRLYRINTHTQYFLQNTVDLAIYCITNNGFQPLALIIQFMRFLNRIRHHNHLLPNDTTIQHLRHAFITGVLRLARFQIPM
jgi:hypothetical protein